MTLSLFGASKYSSPFHRGQPKCLQRHGALLQLVRATITALKNEHNSQMEHLQAIEKVSFL